MNESPGTTRLSNNIKTTQHSAALKTRDRRRCLWRHGTLSRMRRSGGLLWCYYYYCCSCRIM